MNSRRQSKVSIARIIGAICFGTTTLFTVYTLAEFAAYETEISGPFLTFMVTTILVGLVVGWYSVGAGAEHNFRHALIYGLAGAAVWAGACLLGASLYTTLFQTSMTQLTVSRGLLQESISRMNQYITLYNGIELWAVLGAGTVLSSIITTPFGGQRPIE